MTIEGLVATSETMIIRPDMLAYVRNLNSMATLQVELTDAEKQLRDRIEFDSQKIVGRPVSLNWVAM